MTYKCTGLAASWCPVHGDCKCPDGVAGDDERCPLHSIASDHATPSGRPGRVQLQRTKGWEKPADTVNVARPTRWGNPYTVGTDATVTTRTHDGLIADGFTIRLTAQNVVDLFRQDLDARIAEPEPHMHPDDVAIIRRWQRDLEALRGKHLACWCPLDQPCHADVLLDYANRPKQ